MNWQRWREAGQRRQRRGHLFLLRAWRTTVPPRRVSEPVNTAEMRSSGEFPPFIKIFPGGQLLGPTYDYTHRLLDFTLLANGETPTLSTTETGQEASPHVFSLLAKQGLAKAEEETERKLTTSPARLPFTPCSRSSRLQQLMRGDEGYSLALAYSTQRGYGRNHPFAAGDPQRLSRRRNHPEELGFAVNVGELLMTECEMGEWFCRT
ncbi:carbon-phosphorus lyase complex subunit PhnI [Enterobacter cloacae subsp. cloacae]|nr:carbon-phosphorus lyase complex subunit PhnI [Enterobacter cloacae subsp. cloacae]